MNVRYYIPSQAGKGYEVRVRAIDPASIPHDGFGVHLYTEGCLNSRVSQCAAKGAHCIINKIHTPHGLVRSLMFSSIGTTSEDEERTSTIQPDKIGLLQIFVWYTRQEKPMKRSGAEWGISNMDVTVPTVHERSKKAGFNVSTLGKVIQVDHSDELLDAYSRIGDEKHPQATFCIYHQPLAMLQAAGLAPAPEPAPLAPPVPSSPPVPVPLPLPLPRATSSHKRPFKQSVAEAGPSKRTRMGSVGSRIPSPPLLYEDLDDSGKAEAGPTVQCTRSAQPPIRPAIASGDDLMDLGTGPAPELANGFKLLAPQVCSNARIKMTEPKRASNHDGEDVQLRTNAEVEPTTRLSMERHSQEPSRDDPEEDVKPRLTIMASTSSLTEDVKPQTTQTQTIVLDRATQLRAQIAMREIRVKRLTEEEQLLKEKTELAELEAQAQAQQGKPGKERERKDEANEVFDLTTDN
ncbi:hypothetical protein PENSPDRAFT_31859 [Peniophora sp. CONT]|nr:hypothetical protein PENSPDRAFT_31859 [Peniophora sp. CONT]